MPSENVTTKPVAETGTALGNGPVGSEYPSNAEKALSEVPSDPPQPESLWDWVEVQSWPESGDEDEGFEADPKVPLDVSATPEETEVSVERGHDSKASVIESKENDTPEGGPDTQDQRSDTVPSFFTGRCFSIPSTASRRRAAERDMRLARIQWSLDAALKRHGIHLSNEVQPLYGEEPSEDIPHQEAEGGSSAPHSTLQTIDKEVSGRTEALKRMEALEQRMQLEIARRLSDTEPVLNGYGTLPDMGERTSPTLDHHDGTRSPYGFGLCENRKAASDPHPPSSYRGGSGTPLAMGALKPGIYSPSPRSPTWSLKYGSSYYRSDGARRHDSMYAFPGGRDLSSSPYKKQENMYYPLQGDTTKNTPSESSAGKGPGRDEQEPSGEVQEGSQKDKTEPPSLVLPPHGRRHQDVK